MSQAPSRIWAVCLMICFIAALIAGIWLYSIKRVSDAGVHVVDRVMDWPGALADRASHLFETKTTISGTSVSLPVQDVLKIVLIQRRIVCVTTQTNSHLGGASSSVRILKGVYDAYAGYDLNKGFKMVFDETKRTIQITLPPPEVIALKGVPTTYYDQPGWVKPSQAENDQANKENMELAEKESVADLTSEVSNRMKQRIKDLFEPIAAVTIVDSPIQSELPPKM